MNEEKSRFRKMESVWVKDYRRSNKIGWTEGVIDEVLNAKSYLCKIEGGAVWKRHDRQIEPRERTANDLNFVEKEICEKSIYLLPGDSNRFEVSRLHSVANLLNSRDYYSNK
ncbi:unnamed protein product [Phyllotreta striolata]|uniref:Uncharacterized protein n=1 Tax=Phyllotreta striolata TaxID=444603 RepID=A0A9N9TL24_PHYSR|nr:unnamed protein product [Phyllotreta striolata]